MFKLLRTILVALLALILSSCEEKKSLQTNTKKNTNEVILYSWKEYTSLDVLKKFEQETGIKVILKEFETFDEQIGTLQSNPYYCDLTVVDSHVATSQFANMKIITLLDLNQVENKALFDDHFKEFQHYGVPYSFGMTGYAIDSRKIKQKFDDYSFLTDSQFKGKISLLDDPYDTFLTILVATGTPINSQLDDKTINSLKEYSQKLNENTISFNETFTNLDNLVSGEKWIVQTYSGDAASYQNENDFIKFIINKGDFNVWSEIICLTNNAPNKENAYKLLNFLTRPENAAAFSNEFFYANGIKGSDKYLNDTIKENPLINISDDVRKRGQFFLRSKDTNSVMQKIYSVFEKNSGSVENEEEN